jgi:DNA-binding LacI/PurR family transcriptional regulator
MARGRSKDSDISRKKLQDEQTVGLKELAEYLGLAPATVSLVINGSSVADTIAPDTKKAILAAARKFNYRPNFFARCLRTRRSFTIGVMVPEVSEGYNVSVLSGIEDHLLQEGYFYFVASHRFQTDLIEEYSQLFLHRSVDGLIVVCTPWEHALPCPVATISCHHSVKGATRVLVDHDQAAQLALQHLTELGHRKIAFIKGQKFVPDTEVRWKAITRVAASIGLPISPKLVTQIEENSPSPTLGYKATRDLLVAGEQFTALFAFNDICAMGAIRALHEFGLRVPDDVSVLGFDDIESAAYQTRGLTTVQQPLREMGKTAAQVVLNRVAKGKEGDRGPEQILFEPRLVVRETTAPAKQAKVRRTLAEA